MDSHPVVVGRSLGSNVQTFKLKVELELVP